MQTFYRPEMRRPKGRGFLEKKLSRGSKLDAMPGKSVKISSKDWTKSQI